MEVSLPCGTILGYSFGYSISCCEIQSAAQKRTIVITAAWWGIHAQC